MEKSINCSLEAISPLVNNILLPVFYISMLKQRPDFHFEISEVEITRVDCTLGNSLSLSFCVIFTAV